MPDHVWVLSWGYFDNSAFGVMRVYIGEERAKADHKMLEEHAGGDKWWKLTETEVFQ